MGETQDSPAALANSSSWALLQSTPPPWPCLSWLQRIQPLFGLNMLCLWLKLVNRVSALSLAAKLKKKPDSILKHTTTPFCTLSCNDRRVKSCLNQGSTQDRSSHKKQTSFSMFAAAPVQSWFLKVTGWLQNFNCFLKAITTRAWGNTFRITL